MYKILLQQFIKQFGRVPSALEKILLKQKATKQALDQRKVLDLKGNPIDPSKPIIGGKNVKLTHKEKIDWLVKNVDPKAEQTIPPKATLEAMLKDNRGDLIDHFFEMHTKKIGSKPQIKIDTSDLKHPELVAGIIKATKQKPTLVPKPKDIKSKLEKQNKESIQRFKDKMKNPEDLAGGGIAGMLGEPTYQDDNHRVPLEGGKTAFIPPQPDENILESIWKNMGPWEKVLWGLGLSPFEKGGRVDLAGGGLAAALKAIMQKYGKDVVKLAKDVKPSKKWDTLKAIKRFERKYPIKKAGGGPLNTQALIQLYMAEGMSQEEAEAAAGASANLPWNILTEKAEGGRVGMLWGGGIFKTIIQNLARAKGVTPSDYLKVTNWKTLPKEVRNLMSKADFEKMKQGRIEMFENWVEMAKTRMNFLKNVKEGKKTPAAPIFEHLEKSFKSPVPGKVSQKDILQGEYILKNLKTKGQKLHASGGLAKMLGE